jgi:hypothetical protein
LVAKWMSLSRLLESLDDVPGPAPRGVGELLYNRELLLRGLP